ncbi:MAG: competence protein ComEC [Hyphomonadaceae bacterium]|nr:MAG: competence protein ComEC [Hyphomonadaceae bacterium]
MSGAEYFFWQKLHQKVFIIITFFSLLLMAFSSGIIIAYLRANAALAPVIAQNTEPMKIGGILVGVDRSIEGSWRAKIKLDQMHGRFAQNSPKYVRLTTNRIVGAKIGSKFECNAILRPPPPAIIPNAYNFARKAWFLQIGAIGYCKDSPILTEQISPNLIAQLQNSMTEARLKASAKLSKRQTGGGAGFLAAITTGDRSWISKADSDALQGSGLGHIVSVSGIHVSLIAGIIYFALVRIFSLLGAFALWFDVRKIAAVFALICAIGYTVFTGSEAPAIRAALMTTVALTAILIDRKAISLRGLAIAAFIILLFRPEHAADAGFQMSFLATMALVALWEVFVPTNGGAPRALPNKIGFWLLGAVLASLVAGLATLPISISNFGRFSTYGLIANVISAPIVDFIVGPFAVLAAALTPFGLGEWAWKIASWGLDLVLRLAYYFSSIDAQANTIKPLGVMACFTMVFSIVWACFWRSKLKILAIVPLLAAIGVWAMAPLPELYIAAGGKAIYAPKAQVRSGSISRVCFLNGARFDALRLIDAANIVETEKEVDKANIGQRRAQNCAIGRGDWEAHFVSADAIFGQAEKGRAITENTALSITYGNETQAFDAQNLQNGAILYRHGWRLKLYKPKGASRPWSRK